MPHLIITKWAELYEILKEIIATKSALNNHSD